jgi:DNA mismatch endonuclease (patch repair protein)
MDVHPKSIRSKNMGAIGSKNTKPELKLRRALHKMGYRYRLHLKEHVGKPDLVLKKYGAVIFVNGCFWHKHNCYKFRWPKTREDFWKHKLTANRERDERTIQSLKEEGWRVAIVWECALSGKNNPENTVAKKLGKWIKGIDRQIEIVGPSNA